MHCINTYRMCYLETNSYKLNFLIGHLHIKHVETPFIEMSPFWRVCACICREHSFRCLSLVERRQLLALASTHIAMPTRTRRIPKYVSERGHSMRAHRVSCNYVQLCLSKDNFSMKISCAVCPQYNAPCYNTDSVITESTMAPEIVATRTLMNIWIFTK